MGIVIQSLPGGLDLHLPVFSFGRCSPHHCGRSLSQEVIEPVCMCDIASFQWACNLGVFREVPSSLLGKRTARDLVSPVQDFYAFTLDWNVGKKIYLFPSWTLISRVLIQLQTFKGQATLVAPRWPAQPGFRYLSL